ncbi:MAG: hypothetical protein ABSD98_18590, partial [Candidatus Korobacteraceae bacterium]
EAAQVAVRRDPQWGRQFRRLAMRKNRSIAIVATARKLAVRPILMQGHRQSMSNGASRPRQAL